MAFSLPGILYKPLFSFLEVRACSQCGVRELRLFFADSVRAKIGQQLRPVMVVTLQPINSKHESREVDAANEELRTCGVFKGLVRQR